MANHLQPCASIFRAYDIRGIVDETLTEEVVFAVGQVVGTQVLEQQQTTLLIARDGRLSSARLSEKLSDGILASGCNVIDVGMVPSPLLYYATHVFAAHSGVVVTGSHNPANYNGLKIVMNGISLSEEDIQNVYQRIIKGEVRQGIGNYTKAAIKEKYLHAVTENIQLNKPLKVVIDAGNGVTGDIAPCLFSSLGCEVVPLFCEVDGRFPNHHPDPSEITNLRALAAAVEAHQADIGLAFDGDGDRLGVVTNKGEMILADRLLMLFAQSILQEHPQSKIIFDVKCTNNLAPFIRSLHGQPIMWKTGHSLIKAKLAETQALLAGEMSGHFFFNDKWYAFDDALYAGARVLEILSRQEKDSASLFASIPNSINTPEIKVLVTEEEKFSLMQQLIEQADFTEAREVMTIDGLRVDFTDGWGLVRPSNTTPYLVLRFEAINDVILQNIQTMFRELMLSVNPKLVLPF